MNEERKIDVEDLKPGMYISRLDRPWLESPFLFQGFMLEDWDQVAEVRNACRYVYVVNTQELPPAADPSRRREPSVALRQREPGKRSSAGPSVRALGDKGDARRSMEWEVRLAEQLGQAPESPPPVTVRLEDELRSARPLILETHDLVQQQMQDARNGRSLDTESARECVGSITDSILRNPQALSCLSALKKRDEYTYLHSLSVCILSVSFGRYLGLPRERLLDLGYGAFLHDIGKMRIPDSVLNKPEALSPAEMAIMRKHPQYGVDIVEGSDRIPASSRNVIYSHHERLDGSGYAEGTQGARIAPLTHIVSVCDTYDAIISHRPYKEAKSPLDATAILYRSRGRLFDPGLVQRFIGCIGVYPVGSLVELNTGEVGVVIADTAERLRPKLLMVLDEDHQRLKESYTLDLSRALRGNTGQRLDISRSLETGAYGLEPAELLDYVEEV